MISFSRHFVFLHLQRLDDLVGPLLPESGLCPLPVVGHVCPEKSPPIRAPLAEEEGAQRGDDVVRSLLTCTSIVHYSLTIAKIAVIVISFTLVQYTEVVLYLRYTSTHRRSQTPPRRPRGRPDGTPGTRCRRAPPPARTPGRTPGSRTRSKAGRCRPAAAGSSGSSRGRRACRCPRGRRSAATPRR